MEYHTIAEIIKDRFDDYTASLQSWVNKEIHKIFTTHVDVNQNPEMFPYHHFLRHKAGCRAVSRLLELKVPIEVLADSIVQQIAITYSEYYIKMMPLAENESCRLMFMPIESREVAVQTIKDMNTKYLDYEKEQS